MKLISLFFLIIALFLLGSLFVRGRKVIKKGFSGYLLPLILISGLLFVIIGKIAILFALLMIGFILLASSK